MYMFSGRLEGTAAASTDTIPDSENTVTVRRGPSECNEGHPTVVTTTPSNRQPALAMRDTLW